MECQYCRTAWSGHSWERESRPETGTSQAGCVKIVPGLSHTLWYKQPHTMTHSVPPTHSFTSVYCITRLFQFLWPLSVSWRLSVPPFYTNYPLWIVPSDGCRCRGCVLSDTDRGRGHGERWSARRLHLESGWMTATFGFRVWLWMLCVTMQSLR